MVGFRGDISPSDSGFVRNLGGSLQGREGLLEQAERALDDGLVMCQRDEVVGGALEEQAATGGGGGQPPRDRVIAELEKAHLGKPADTGDDRWVTRGQML